MEQQKNPEITSYKISKMAAARVLKSMSSADVRNLYYSLGLTPAIAEAASKDFVIGKIIEKTDVNNLLKDKEFIVRIMENYYMISTGLERTLDDFDRETIVEVYKELSKEALVEEEKKLKIIERLIVEIPFDKIWKSKTLRKRITSQKLSKADLKRLSKEISSLNQGITEMWGKHQEKNVESFNELENRIQHTIMEIQQLSKQQEMLLGLLSMKDAPSASDFLESFRKELLALQDTLSPERLCELVEKSKSRLRTNDFAFTSRGLEIMLAYYLSTKIKKMEWPADFEEFVKTVQEEIPKIEILPNQAEIPTLRERVTSRLGISEGNFDKQLVQAWQKGYVSLHSGAPRGREEVKFLEYDGNKYFYVSLRGG